MGTWGMKFAGGWCNCPAHVPYIYIRIPGKATGQGLRRYRPELPIIDKIGIAGSHSPTALQKKSMGVLHRTPESDILRPVLENADPVAYRAD